MSCDCVPPSVRVNNFPVATKHSSAFDFIALTAPISTTGIKRILLLSYVECFMDQFEFKFGYQTSDDLRSWSGVTDIGSAYDDTTAQNTWLDDSVAISTEDLYLRVGVQSRDTNPSDVHEGIFLLSLGISFQNW